MPEAPLAVGVTVVAHDTPENILERIIFYDIDSRPIDKHLTDEEQALYLRRSRADICYFKRPWPPRPARQLSTSSWAVSSTLRMCQPQTALV